MRAVTHIIDPGACATRRSTRRDTSLLVAGLALALGACAPSPAAPATTPPVSTAADAGAPHWSYAGDEGPAHWGDLSPDFAVCKSGSRQTPVDLPASADADHTAALAFGYHPFPTTLLDNGHTLQVVAASGSSLVVGPTPADRYELVQFHFHSPSEHTLAGQAFDLELHLVHKNASGNLAVVGLLFKAGKDNPMLAPLFAQAPTTIGTPTHVDNPATVDPSALLPANAGYFHYDGSLTTPPCSEDVAWYVMSSVGEVSQAQIDRYRALFHGPTNRPVQPLGGRSVVQYRP
jgi:carbonic anhydrase